MEADARDSVADNVAKRASDDVAAAKRATFKLDDGAIQRARQDSAYADAAIDADRELASARRRAAGDGKAARYDVDRLVAAYEKRDTLYRARIDSLASRNEALQATLDTVRSALFSVRTALDSMTAARDSWRRAAAAADHEATLARGIARSERNKRFAPLLTAGAGGLVGLGFAVTSTVDWSPAEGVIGGVAVGLVVGVVGDYLAEKLPFPWRRK